ncbi:uncharacterized protein LOC134008481 isoform X2 [Osmerus eperlanus]|uniref:uncharacterized protein LOC134008481 isoform X2 n=1 Tax=Osmerus eperlanus TaxID=29151 RepID=UPI002E143A92
MVEDDTAEFFLPQVNYELMESKMPREVSKIRRMYEEKLKQSLEKQKQRYEYPLKNMEDELNLYKTEKVPKEGLRKSSLDIPPTSRGKEQETKDDLGRQKVDLEVVGDGYTKTGMTVMKHYIKPLFMIGAQHGLLGSCVGIVVVIVSVVLCYTDWEAVTAAKDNPSTPVQTTSAYERSSRVFDGSCVLVSNPEEHDHFFTVARATRCSLPVAPGLATWFLYAASALSEAALMITAPSTINKISWLHARMLDWESQAQLTQLSVQKGKTVTLETHVAGLQPDDGWIYNKLWLLQVNPGKLRCTLLDERFTDRLQLDLQTGSLTVRNISLHDAGVYQLQTGGDKLAHQTFTLSVYDMVSGPAISYSYLRLSANNISCTVECSVKNGRDVTLTWYKGEERLNQTSSPDLSSNISLHLEMKDQDGDTYSCVAENPISNQTDKLHKTELCPGLSTTTNFHNHTRDRGAVAVAVIVAVAYRKFKVEYERL